MNRKERAALIEMVRAEYEATGDATKAARNIAGDLPEVVARTLAATWLAEQGREKSRRLTLEAERKAMRTEIMSELTGSWGAPPSKAPVRREWEATTPEGRAEMERRADEYAEHQNSLWRSLNRVMTQYEAELKMKWTTELLCSTFALEDGTTVTWGEATVYQHEQRRATFVGNAVANLEGAARHQAAIKAITEAGGSCLRDVVGTHARAEVSA